MNHVKKMSTVAQLQKILHKTDEVLQMDDMFADLDRDFDDLDFTHMDEVTSTNTNIQKQKAELYQKVDALNDTQKRLMEKVDMPTSDELSTVYNEIYKRVAAYIELKIN